MLRSGKPVLTKVVNQIRSHILPSPIAHPSGSGQFDHIGIDEGICCSSLFPSLQGFRIALRSSSVCLLDSTMPKSLGPFSRLTNRKNSRQKVQKITSMCAFIGHPFFLIFFDLPINLNRGQTASGQPGR